MKLSFSTLGCPDWDLQQMINSAADCGFDGIDFRCYKGQTELYKRKEFNKDIKKTVEKISKAGLDVPCISSSIRINYSDQNTNFENYEILRKYLEICRHFNTPFIRIFGGNCEDTAAEAAVEKAACEIDKMAEIAAEKNISILIETHDSWISSDKLKRLMGKVSRTNTGIIWDTHHTFRFCGETPEYTRDKIGQWIKYTHWKDSAAKKDSEEFEIKGFGEGDVPIKDTIKVLKNSGYDGYLAFEWEKFHHPEIAPPEEAFPAFTAYIKSLL